MEQVTLETMAAPPDQLTRVDAFRRLAELHLEGSYRLARAILGSDAEAEDATHDAFLAAWRAWSTLRDPTRFERWFQRILVNTCRNRLRKSARIQVTLVSPELTSAAPDHEAETDDREVLAHAIAQLPTDDRVVLALRYYRDLSVREIADLLGIRAGTVKSRIHYALRRLEGALDAADAREVLR